MYKRCWMDAWELYDCSIQKGHSVYTSVPKQAQNGVAQNGTVIIAHFILVCYVDTPQRPPQGAFEIPPPQPFAGVSQLARESGSYPECHWFESDRRYQQNRSG